LPLNLNHLFNFAKQQHKPIPKHTIDMPNHTEPTAMDIDLPTSPTKSDFSASSDSSQVSYTDDFETMPSNGPASHAHIIDLGEYATVVKEEGALKLQDAVVTTLFNVSPATLKSFVRPTVNTFKAVFGKKDVQLVIWRKGLEVFVSHPPHYPSDIN
jgi:hypothetical protein